MSAPRNVPVKVKWEDGATRLFNLVIALINSPAPRSTAWILNNVAGYDAEQEGTNRKRFHRDRDTLQTLGVQLIGELDLDGHEHWRLDRRSSFLPELDLTEEEAEVLAAAARWNQPGELSTAAESAYRKLASAGIRRDMGSSVIPSVPDHTDLDQDSVEAIFRALDRGLVLSFNYYRSLLEEPVRRSVEPWAYGAVDGKIYLTGFDLDRNQQRTFRLSRIADMEAMARFAQHPVPEGSSDELIRHGLSAAGTFVTARVRFQGNTGAEELRALCDEDGCIGPIERSWLVRTAAAYAPEAVITEPQDVVDSVVSLLQHVAEGESVE